MAGRCDLDGTDAAPPDLTGEGAGKHSMSRP
jgi:hypothetical protein